MSTIITQDGIVATFSGTLTTGYHVDGVSPWVVAPPGGVTLTGVAIDTAETVAPTNPDLAYVGLGSYLGGVMVDPAGFKQGMDPRVNAITTTGPGMEYATGQFYYDAGLTLSLPATVDHYVDGSPKTIWCYRGTDTIQRGGQSNGCYRIVEITVYSSNPGANAIKPTGLYVATGKPCYTTDDIDYNLYTPITRPVGYAEPDWDQDGPDYYHTRPLVKFGPTTWAATWIPWKSQGDGIYPAYQAANTNKMILGALSDSPDRVELINRIVRDGLMAYSHIALDLTCDIAIGGFGNGMKGLAYFAGRFLGVPAMCAKPPKTSAYTTSPVDQDVFGEDGYVFDGVTEALYGGTTAANYGTPPYFDNHDIRDINGLTDPTEIAKLSGTAQGGSSSTIQLAAGSAAPSVGYLIHITGGTGAGQVREIASYDSGTKTITINTGLSDGGFSPAPTAGSTYKHYNVGAYQTIGSQSMTGLAIALVLAHETVGWGNDTFFEYCKRWIDEDGLIRFPFPTYPSWQSASADNRKWLDTSNWTKLFYNVAQPIWPGATTGPAIAVVAGSFTFSGMAAALTERAAMVLRLRYRKF